MKLLVNLTLSLVVLGLCLWLVWPNPEMQGQLAATLRGLDLGAFWPTVGAYVALLAATHFFRAWRWNNLLRPMGVSLPPGKLLSISSIGFMTILALPARLGELTRPALLRRKGKVSASAVLGTVAVERIVDGVIVSLLVFATCFALRDGPHEKPWMMPMAYVSLAVFVAAMVFLGFALRWPQVTVRVGARMMIVPLLVPRLGPIFEEKIRSLIQGFLVLKDWGNLARFFGWSVLYWGTNGLGMWVLARGMGLELSPIGAFATMGIIAVGISLPNSPGLVGQFHYLTTLGLSLYLPDETARSAGLAYAILLHGIQVVWYVAAGAIAMLVSRVSFADIFRGRSEDAVAVEKT